MLKRMKEYITDVSKWKRAFYFSLLGIIINMIFGDFLIPIIGLDPIQSFILKSLSYIIIFMVGFMIFAPILYGLFPWLSKSDEDTKEQTHKNLKDIVEDENLTVESLKAIDEDDEYVTFEATVKHVEPLSAKIRNKLSPYWNLVAMIKEYEKDKDEEILEYIMKEVKNIDNKKDILLDLINSIDEV